MDERKTMLRARARAFADTALDVVQREYPNSLRHTTADPDDRPREAHPAFYGSYDWHSCVEMHWVLVRLLRLVPDLVPADEARALLDAHLTPHALDAEAAYLAAHPGWERPYGWGWALTLAHELGSWNDEDGRRWFASTRALTDVVAAHYTAWLPRATYPERYGMHANSAFGLALAWGFAHAHDPVLADALRAAALRWFADDVDAPARWEPSGSDFLSPALVEAELMSRALDAAAFPAWLEQFLPRLADGNPASLFTPATVSDPTDGQIAHLHGLNLSRAWAFRRIVDALPGDDARIAPMLAAAERHAAASLDEATGSDYMVEHWLAAYAVLYLSEEKP